jgi:hypothetical protein
MGLSLLNLTLLADAGSLMARLAENRAGAISLVGLSAVFCGLLLLFSFMRLLTYVTGLMEARSAAPVEPAGVVAKAWEHLDGSEDEDVLPEIQLRSPLSLPASHLAVALVARSLFKVGKFPIGEEVVVVVDGTPLTVELVGVGLGCTAIVNGRKVIFYREHTAGARAKA